MRAIVVGEAWGAREAQFRHALVGPTGRELTLMAGFANLMPHMLIPCRKCKRSSRYITPHCEFCGDLIWPNEFTLIDHWKRMKAECDIHVTNVFNTKPPDVCSACHSIDTVPKGNRRMICRTCGSTEVKTNEVGYFFGTERMTEMPGWKASQTYGGSHIKAEYFHHVKRLWHEIEDFKPNLILALGNAACWATLDQTKISTLRGTISWSERLNCKVLPTYHPAAILRQPKMRPTVIADLTKASREIEYPEVRRTPRWITVIDPTPEGIAAGYEWFKRPARAYANDIETVRKQISIIGFARNPDDALVIVFRDCHSEKGKIVEIGKSASMMGHNSGVNFFPTSDLEYEAWKLAIYGLQTPQPKIFQNGIYDLSYYIRMGIHPKNARHDSMLWHHSMYPELPKSLGYLGSLYANEIAWKSMRKSSDSLKRDE